MLSQAQCDQFWRDGVLVVEDAVAADQLLALGEAFADWARQSRSYSEDNGKTLNGRACFDLEPGHNAQSCALRRVQCPEEVAKDTSFFAQQAAAEEA